jgi:uncharacterized membrane protein YagU involved in acid resistance
MNRTIKDAFFGVIGGIAGTAVINQVMAALSELDTRGNRSREQQLVPEPPTEKLARRVARRAFGMEVSDEQKARMGQLLQWGYGVFWGGVYGVLRRRIPTITRGAALPFGVGFGLFGPAILLPLMDLTPPPTEFPITSHARNLLSHYAYAATVEGVCRLCEKVDQKVAGEHPRTKPELRRVS